MTNLKVNIAGVSFKNPVITASGCFGFGRNMSACTRWRNWRHLAQRHDLSGEAGQPAAAHRGDPERHVKLGGTAEPGVEHFLEYDMPYLAKQDTVKIANIAGSSIEDYCAIAERLSESEIDMFELNISCPNVKQGGAAFGTSCESAERVVKEVRKYAKKPMIVKLSPNVTDIVSIAKAVEAQGADAVSLINTLLGMRIDINTRRPILKNNVGGLSGPAIFPVAVRMVWQVANAVKVPVIGMGGIEKWQDAIEMMMAGANAIQIGAAMFYNPMAPVQVIEGMRKWLEDNHIEDINEIVGSVRPW